MDMDYKSKTTCFTFVGTSLITEEKPSMKVKQLVLLLRRYYDILKTNVIYTNRHIIS